MYDIDEIKVSKEDDVYRNFRIYLENLIDSAALISETEDFSLQERVQRVLEQPNICHEQD